MKIALQTTSKNQPPKLRFKSRKIKFQSPSFLDIEADQSLETVYKANLLRAEKCSGQIVRGESLGKIRVQVTKGRRIVVFSNPNAEPNPQFQANHGNQNTRQSQSLILKPSEDGQRIQVHFKAKNYDSQGHLTSTYAQFSQIENGVASPAVGYFEFT